MVTSVVHSDVHQVESLLAAITQKAQTPDIEIESYKLVILPQIHCFL